MNRHGLLDVIAALIVAVATSWTPVLAQTDPAAGITIEQVIGLD